jgi:hypothetical protein
METRLPIVRARVPTAHASRYLQQLCKHWGHRYPVSYDAQRGTIDFSAARCSFEAEPAVLVLTIESADPAVLPGTAEIVEKHLKRFAFRESLVIDWSPATHE